MNNYIKEFKSVYVRLTANQKQVLEILIDAAKLISSLYQLQLCDNEPGAISYPKGVSKEQISKAAKNSPDILSPDFVVEKQNGKLIATPYHKKYVELLKPITEKLFRAASLTDNPEFSKYLKVLASSLLTGDYDKAITVWLNSKPYILNIVIGPIERYDDELFFVKTAYQAWVGVMDESETKIVNTFKFIILSSQRKTLMPSEHVKFFDKIQVRIDHTVIFSGLIAKFGFTGTNLPNSVKLMEKYGSHINIFKPSLEEWFVKKHYPIFEAVFEKRFRQSYKQKDLFKGSLRNIVLHELAHSFMRYRDAETRLGNLFPVIDEIAASILGVKACGSLVLKDAITQKDLEYIMVMFIARLFDWLDQIKTDPQVIHYLKGNAIALNYLFASGALRQKNGIYWPNFNKMFIAIDELAGMLDRLLSAGSYKDAQIFIQKHGSLEVFKSFKPILKALL